MALMKKTGQGTVFAATFDDKDKYGTHVGLFAGIYDKGNVLSIESFNGELVIMLNDDAIDELGINVIHTDMQWNIKEQED